MHSRELRSSSKPSNEYEPLMIDLEAIAKIISAAKDLLPALGDAWKGQPEDDPTQKEIRALVQEQYEALRNGVGSASLRMLSHLDGCGSCEPDLLILEADARMGKVSGSAQKFLKIEFAYHLAYLVALGVVSPAGPTEYRISHLGKNFVREARYRDDYPEVLHA